MIAGAVLSPHPPLIIPEIGGTRLQEVEPTIDGMSNMARAVAALQPDNLIFITPHGNAFSDIITCLGENYLEEDLSAFGLRRKGISYKNDLKLLNEIKRLSLKAGIELAVIDNQLAKAYRLNPKLDHGVAVPLYYLRQAGLKDIPLIAFTPGYLPVNTLYRFGALIKEASNNLGKRTVIIASGDMSHRLTNDGPYDYHPDGPVFDQTVKSLIEIGDIRGILDIPEKLRDNAGQCGYFSLVIMLGALDGREFESRVFSYEGPFGVGYLTAVFIPRGETASYLEEMARRAKQEIASKRLNESKPVKWARMTLENYIKTGKLPNLPLELQDLRQTRAGVFVSIKKQGRLRGCIGTLEPVHDNLAAEIQSNAISAGTRDPRFSPVGENELDDLVYSVDILSPSMACRKEDLDPKKYGVIVSHGNKKGVLLPDLEGIDTVEEQLAIALQKAGIKDNAGYRIERFEVRRYS
ncbi:MAG: AmmeMemoRadiSam system protein A [Syntrophomonadaceae bacterium]|nr:AmmeMemoRadiSam system protein A [Syntrophomonadaceae bacterium]